MLERLQEAPSTRTVYVLGIPTARVPNPDHITSYKARNKVRRGASYDAHSCLKAPLASCHCGSQQR